MNDTGDPKEMIKNHSSRAKTYKFLRRNFITICLFSSVFIFLVFVTSGEWAKNDDYVDLGLNRFGNWGFLDAVKGYLPSNAGAGRPLHVIWQSIIFPNIDSVNDLSKIRVIHSLIFSTLTTSLYHALKPIFKSRSLALTASLIPLILPGSWGLISYTSAAPFAISIVLGIYAYCISLRINESNLRSHLLLLYSTFIFAGLFSVFLYQPAIFFLPLLPLLDFIAGRFDREANFASLKQKMESVIAVVISSSICLAINYIFVITFYDSPRAEGQIWTSGHLHFVLNSEFDRIVASSILRLPVVGLFTNLIAILLVSFTAGIYFQLIRTNARIIVSNQRYTFLFKITDFLTMFSLLPMILIFMFFIPEHGTDFRRYYFAGITVSILLLANPVFTSAKSFTNFKVIQYILPIIAAILVMLSGFQFRSSTIDLASREWTAAVCSSQVSEAPSDSLFNFNESDFAFYQKLNGPSDEFNVLSLFRPVAGQMLIWSSYNTSLNQPYILNPWDIKITISTNPSTKWPSNFLKCFSN